MNAVAIIVIALAIVCAVGAIILTVHRRLLPREERDALAGPLNRIRDAYVAGQINIDQYEELVGKLLNGETVHVPLKPPRISADSGRVGSAGAAHKARGEILPGMWVRETADPGMEDRPEGPPDVVLRTRAQDVATPVWGSSGMVGPPLVEGDTSLPFWEVSAVNADHITFECHAEDAIAACIQARKYFVALGMPRTMNLTARELGMRTEGERR